MLKRILVTGGAGFIGSNLCERLAKDKNNKVYSLDNYFTGSIENHVSNVEYINCNTVDISHYIDFSPDVIFHLGEYSRVEQSFEDIKTVWKFNKDGIFAVLEFARKTGAKVIYSGSSTKFGDGGLGRNASPYAWTKASNTELTKNYGLWFDVPYAITYFYNVYGTREIKSGKYATLIAIFKEQMRKNAPLTVVGPGIQKRNFTHIDDIVDGLIMVADIGYGDDFGIGSSENYSILDIAQMFGGEVKMLPERRGNRMTSDLMTEKTESLGWTATRSIKDYIEKAKINGWK